MPWMPSYLVLLDFLSCTLSILEYMINFTILSSVADYNFTLGFLNEG